MAHHQTDIRTHAAVCVWMQNYTEEVCKATVSFSSSGTGVRSQWKSVQFGCVEARHQGWSALSLGCFSLKAELRGWTLAKSSLSSLPTHKPIWQSCYWCFSSYTLMVNNAFPRQYYWQVQRHIFPNFLLVVAIGTWETFGKSDYSL